MIEIDVINDKQITAEISGDEIVINVLKYDLISGVTTYDGLTDTPSSKTGKAGQYVGVNSLETLHEYVKYRNIVTLTDGATIALDLDSWIETYCKLEGTTRTATTLNLTNFPDRSIFNLSITKNNSDQDLVFTLGGTNLVYDVFDSTNNVYTRATTVTISGTDTDQSWELSFKNTGIADGTDTVIQVTGTIDSFA